jgi:hypothetical protein
MRGALQTVVAFALVGLLAALVNWQRRVDVEISLAATLAEVWSVISDTNAYQTWNPVLARMDGEAQNQGPLTFIFAGDGTPPETLTGTWIEARPGRLAWEVKPGIGRWYDRLYFIRVDAGNDSGSKVRIGVVASGVSVVWRADDFAAQTQPALAQMLEALAATLNTTIQ